MFDIITEKTLSLNNKPLRQPGVQKTVHRLNTELYGAEQLFIPPHFGR